MHMDSRKCSPFLAAGLGAAICLTGGGAWAGSGTIKQSNAGSIFSNSSSFSVFSHRFRLHVNTNLVGLALTQVGNDGSIGASTAQAAYLHDAGVTVDAGMNFETYAYVLSGQADNKYLAITFDAPRNFGWVQVVTSDSSSITISNWGFNDTAGGSIKTVSDRPFLTKLPLSGGTSLLSWGQLDEQGVARYEVQQAVPGDAWVAVHAEQPGAQQYQFVPFGESACRLVVERVDGTTEAMGF
jgi:hypothetical protein